ncbi:MAG: hypothetical protein KC584_11540 [Nitrospira sp.]|nr:hypothetical protein [Nitrospira sp.]
MNVKNPAPHLMDRFQFILQSSSRDEQASAARHAIGIMNKDTTVLTGQELEHCSPQVPAHLFEHTRVYARTTPARKIAIVKALQARGEFVCEIHDDK